MVDYNQDLWTDEINSTELIDPLIHIKEQGKILGKKTIILLLGK